MNIPKTEIVTCFFTETGIEVPSVTEEQMREIDRIALEETGPNLFQMMENAGRNLALLALERLGPVWYDSTVLVLAGTGGNGGGGICAARHLANRGVKVKLCVADPNALGAVPAFQLKIFQSTSGKEVTKDRLKEEPVNLILDALIGYSLKRAPTGVFAELIQWVNQADVPVLSLDIPSGVDATTGETPGEFVRPRWTMTLALPKKGLFLERASKLFLADIGIPEGTYRRMGLPYVSPFGNHYWIPLFCRR